MESSQLVVDHLQAGDLNYAALELVTAGSGLGSRIDGWPACSMADIRRLVRRITAYSDYNSVCVHLALEKDAPFGGPAQAIGSVVAIPLLGSLHHKNGRIA